jgi:hypothetical protein
MYFYLKHMFALLINSMKIIYTFSTILNLLFWGNSFIVTSALYNKSALTKPAQTLCLYLLSGSFFLVSGIISLALLETIFQFNERFHDTFEEFYQITAYRAATRHNNRRSSSSSNLIKSRSCYRKGVFDRYTL